MSSFLLSFRLSLSIPRWPSGKYVQGSQKSVECSNLSLGMDMTPEAQARGGIDAALAVAGWVVQDYRKVDLGASSGVALREVPLKSGRCDYLLLVNRMRVRIVESTGISNLQRTTRLRQSILQKVFFAKSLTH
jgi:hypothetical protein